MNYCANDKGVQVSGVTICSSCVSMNFSCCDLNHCSSKVKVLKTIGSEIFGIFEAEKKNLMCQLPVASIDSWFLSRTSMRYGFEAMCQAAIPG